ncbi:hypothetical protein ACYOEI_39450, partial [Singulisphaera rosea]
MNPMIVVGLAAATAIAFVVAIYQVLSDLFLRDRTRVNDRVDFEFLKKNVAAKAKKSPLFKNLDLSAAEAIADEAPSGLRERFEIMVEQSGLNITPVRVVSIAVVLA